MNLLTSELIKKTKPNAKKRITLRDGLGLFLRIQPSNARSWVLRLNINGRSWMADHDFPYEASEACLAHVTGNAVTQAYQRSDYLAQRRAIMSAWCEYVRQCADCARRLVLESNKSASSAPKD